MRARKMNLWTIVGCTAILLGALYGFKMTKQHDQAPEKEICREPARETALKKASLQLWENIVRL